MTYSELGPTNREPECTQSITCIGQAARACVCMRLRASHWSHKSSCVHSSQPTAHMARFPSHPRPTSCKGWGPTYRLLPTSLVAFWALWGSCVLALGCNFTALPQEIVYYYQTGKHATLLLLCSLLNSPHPINVAREKNCSVSYHHHSYL